MLVDAWEGHHRSVVKAISWRIAGSLDTLLLSYLVTRSITFATSIAGIETITKIVLYYIHERAWTIIPWGKGSRSRRVGEWVTGCLATLRAAVRSVPVSRSLQPSRVAAAAALLFCLAIVLMPPRAQFRHSVAEAPATPQSEPVLESRAATVPHQDQGVVHQDNSASTEAKLTEANLNVGPIESPRMDGSATQIVAQQSATEMRGNVAEPDRVKQIQHRLIQLGYLSAKPTGWWGPLSRAALSAFKSDHDLPADAVWDEATERTLFNGEPARLEPFIGVWGADPSACSARLNRARSSLPAVIESEGAWAGETFCAFHSKKRTRHGWELVASCSNSRARWVANVQLAVAGPQLVWTSERGVQTYVRCQPSLGIARAM